MKHLTCIPHRLLLLLVLVIASSFTPPEACLEDSTSQPSTTAALVTDGLYFAQFYDYIYRGHFEHLDFTREDPMFSIIFGSYLNAFGTQCKAYLPANKVEMQKQVCKTENVTTNGYGVEVERYCVEYVWVGSGIYAKPDLYNAKIEIENELRKKGLETVIAIIMDPNGVGNSVDMIHKTKGLQGDMARFFKLNPGNGAAILAFEENLKRYARNQPSVRLKEESKYTTMKNTGGPTTPQNLNKLLDDLVRDQSKTWAMNRYVPNSMAGIHKRKDPTGKLVALSASYTYKGLLGTQKNNVRITFKNGLPDCIYFSDYPNNCKSPNSSIVAAFAKGDYGSQ